LNEENTFSFLNAFKAPGDRLQGLFSKTNPFG